MKAWKVEFTGSDNNNKPRKPTCMLTVFLSWLSWSLFVSCVILTLLLIFLKIIPQIFVTIDSEASDANLQYQMASLDSSIDWKHRHKKVLILAQGRSGSSFLGEIFNQHPDVLYLYEPLHAYKIFSMTGIFPAGTYGVNALQVLFDLFNCHFSSLQDYLTFISFPELSSPHFRLASKTLSSPPFCKARATQDVYDKQSAEQYREFCPQLHFKKVTNACKVKRYTVVKDLAHRMPLENTTNLERLMTLQGDLHLVYLVRDPRAVVMSMKRMYWIGDGPESKYPDVESAASFLCKQTLEMLWGIDRWSVPFGPRVHLIRYEDLASNSVQKAEELFESLGITFPDEVRHWVQLNTNSNQSNKIDPYRVDHRNASLSLHSWKSSISNQELKLIQDQCLTAMSILKYNTFDDVVYLRDPVLPSFRIFSY